MQRAGAGRAFGVVAAAAQGLEALGEAVLGQPGPEGRAARVRVAEQFDAVGAAIAVDVVDAQVLRGTATGAGPAVVAEDLGAELGIPVAFRFPSLPEIRLGPAVYTCSFALRLRATGPPWCSRTRPGCSAYFSTSAARMEGDAPLLEVGFRIARGTVTR